MDNERDLHCQNSTNGNMPVVKCKNIRNPHNGKVFFGGDSAFGPKNVITAVAHGHRGSKYPSTLFAKTNEYQTNVMAPNT